MDDFLKPIFDELTEEYRIANEIFKFWYIVSPSFKADIKESWNGASNDYPMGSVTMVLDGTITAHSFHIDHDAHKYFEYWEDRMRNRWSERMYWINGTGYNLDFDLKSALV